MKNFDQRAGIFNPTVARENSLRRRRAASAVRRIAVALFGFVWLVIAVVPLRGREHKKKDEDYGLGFSTEIAAPESEVLEAVETVVSDGIIQGSFEYTKDKYIEQAAAATSSSLFPEWKDPGTVFYKVRTDVLAPANFKETSDQGTLAVRYIVQSKDTHRTILRIDAIFVEDFRRTVHPSDGSVESAEYKDIQDHVDALQLQKTQAQDSAKQRQEQLAKQALDRKSEEDETLALANAQTSAGSLQEHVEALRHQAERVIKSPGAQLKSAPFHTASTLKSLEAGTEVVIVIATQYWYGVETEDGQHGWVHRDQLEPLP
jgi:hypothetical protein